MNGRSPRDGRSLLGRAQRGEPSRSGRAIAGAAERAAETRVSQCYGTREPRGVPALLARPRAAPGAVRMRVTRVVLVRWGSFGLVGQRDLVLYQVAARPHHMVTAHDGVHRVGLPQERRRVGARHLGPWEQVPAAVSAGMTVNRADRTGPTGFLTRLLRHDVGRGRLRRIHARRRDALHDHRPAAHLTDPAPHDLPRERPVLENEEAAGLLGDGRVRTAWALGTTRAAAVSTRRVG